MLFVRDHRGLERFLGDLAGCDAISVDTEFVREGTYRPHLALVQVAGPEDRLAVIDPFSAAPLDGLFAILRDRAIEKVMHSARQDIEILWARMGDIPRPVFDTQVAAAFLGYGEQIGLADLLKAELGVVLGKSETYTDWLRRPLSPAQVDYAADDVRYLLPLARRLKAAIQERGRLAWVEEALASLAEVAQFGVDPEAAYLQVRRAGSLARRELGILRELAAWREREAERQDRPARAVAADECLIELAKRQPPSLDAIARMRGLGRVGREAAQPIAEAIKRGQRLPEEALPEPIAAEEPDPDLRLAVDVALAALRVKAQAASVGANHIASAAEVVRLIRSFREGTPAPEVPLLRGWRYECAGRDLLGLLSGALGLALEGGRASLFERAR